MTEQTAVPGAATHEGGEPGRPDVDAARLDTGSRGRAIAIVATIILFTEVVPFQYSLITLVVPAIGRQFPEAGSGVTWVITILGVVGGATMALLGKMGDIWGKKRVLLGSSVLFLAGAFICATVTSWPVFLVGRGLQATSLGMAAISYGLIRDILPRRWIPVAVGFVATGFGVSGIIAPIIGGILTQQYSWRSVFWFLGVYMLVMIPLFAWLVPGSGIRVRQRLDWVGALLIGIGTALVLVYLSEGGSLGWGSPLNLTFLAIGVVAFVLFVVWEGRVENPIMELSLLREPRVALLLAIAFTATAVIAIPGFAAAYMFLTDGEMVRQGILAAAAAQANLPITTVAQGIRFQGDISYAHGYSILEFAVRVTIWTSLASMVAGPVAGAVSRRIGARIPLIVGTVLLIVASALLVPFHTTWQEQLVLGIVIGLGMGTYYAASPNLLIDAVPVERQGVSAGMQAVFGGIGSAAGIAIVTSILSSHPFQIVSAGADGSTVVTDIPQVYTSQGYGMGYLVIGLGGGIVTLLLALMLRSGRTPSRGGA